MAQVNLITKNTADRIAASYFKSKSVSSLYVTRDGQVFYKGKEHYLKMHERVNNLEPSWLYPMDNKEVDDNKPEVKTEEPNIISFTYLKKYFKDLTDKDQIKEDEWISLKFAQLRKKYEEINNNK